MAHSTAGPLANAHRFGPAAPDETHVFGACAPGWHSAGTRQESIDDWLSFVRDRDVSRVCCLLAGDGALLDDYRAEFGRDRVRHVPVPDGRLVTRSTLIDDVLPFLDTSVETDERVVVHGLAGIDRVGQVLAAWLVHDRNYVPERAIETVGTQGRCAIESVEEGDAEMDDLLAVLSAVRD
jgi:protein-tyrosine phosphatase